jgi:hypothetical protein
VCVDNMRVCNGVTNRKDEECSYDLDIELLGLLL